MDSCTMTCSNASPTQLLHAQSLKPLRFTRPDQRRATRNAGVACTCKLNGRSLEATVASNAGRSLSVQLGSTGSKTSATAAASQKAVEVHSQVADAVQQQAENVEGSMLEPSVANKNWVRVLAVSAAVLVAARLSPSYLPSKNVAFLHLLAFSTFVGTNIWTTFVAGFTMFKNLPRQTFGKLQAKLFPKYFALLSAACVVCMGTITFSPGASLPRSQAISLGIGLFTTVLNWLYVEPKNTELMSERYTLENAKGQRDEAKIAQMRKEFGKWHGFSSVLNLAGLCGVVAHGWWLSGKMALIPA